ncbi:aminodeoxychorismate lyase [Neiella marina]|uniref:Aminodeoxychorismate lyase n=1 Tax=Neiella holothuriorum TaxID=2870530 RepID=A0ABS7EL47_9GAMM|nr:aminodeoxychorismate lyase [Neiella holothuriorum]MBW8192608.1 aminodeoxychorismate lyase [Neiella holothuriorum]
MMWINGITSQQIGAAQRAVSFGDGVFTTFRVINGCVQHIEAHIERLQRACLALAIDAIDWPLLEQELVAAARSAQQPLMVGKAIVSRGQGGRGYSCEGVDSPARVVALYPFPSHVAKWRQQGIQLLQAELQLGIQPKLAGYKTLNRLEQVLGKQELSAKGAVEGVFCDSDGYVVECNAANLFWRRGDLLYTPDLSLAGVAGIMRQKILDFCHQHQYRVHQVRVQPAQLEEADELFICNGIIGPVPVTGYQQHHYSSHFLCRLLQKELDPLES